MAFRARLGAPPAPQTKDSPYHSVVSGSVRATVLAKLDRRIEAETYLSQGSGIRATIESRADGWLRLRSLAHVVMPSRLKGILVDRAYGAPYLSAMQVFDVRPRPRKFLALEQTSASASYRVNDGVILVTRSGSVGRTTLAHYPHRNTIISDDLLRVLPKDGRYHGWLYAFLQSSQAQAMMTSVHYGHIIKHLETDHLGELPIPTVSDSMAEHFERLTNDLLQARNESHELSDQADRLFAEQIGDVSPTERNDGYTIRARALMGGRRRLEAAFYVPQAAAIVARFTKSEPLLTLAKRVWWMSRFKRFFGTTGMPYLSADELFTVNPKSKQILVDPGTDYTDYFVDSGWIVMACSGQVYGLNGEATLMCDRHEKVFFSHDLIRIVADPEKVRAGYLLVALTHPTHGRPLLIRAAYGTSIPHLDPGDVEQFPVVRLGRSTEAKIADLAEAAAEARNRAEHIERQIATEAGRVVSDLMAKRA